MTPVSNTAPQDNIELQLDEAMKAIGEMEEKYFDLVWYARKDKDRNGAYWNGTPESIKQGAFKNIARVEEFYPDECDELNCAAHGDWTHGFNSGVLAAMRFVQTAMYRHYIDDPNASDDGEPFWCGGVDEAKDEFPQLDT